MVITPGIKNLECEYKDGIKHFTLIAEEVELELIDGLFAKAWGYNGSVPGPTIIVNPGVWPMHCHMPHHVTNNGAPGVGGMFTTVNYIS